MQICWLENVVFVLMMSRCSYLNHTVLTYTVHNSCMILLKPLWKKRCVGYNNSLRRLMKLDKHCNASETFVHNGIPAFGELQRKHITNFIHGLQSSSNSIIMSVVLSSVPLTSLIWGYWSNTLHTSKWYFMISISSVYASLITCLFLMWCYVKWPAWCCT